MMDGKSWKSASIGCQVLAERKSFINLKPGFARFFRWVSFGLGKQACFDGLGCYTPSLDSCSKQRSRLRLPISPNSRRGYNAKLPATMATPSAAVAASLVGRIFRWQFSLIFGLILDYFP